MKNRNGKRAAGERRPRTQPKNFTGIEGKLQLEAPGRRLEVAASAPCRNAPQPRCSSPIRYTRMSTTTPQRTMVHDPTLAPIARTADLRALEVRHAADGLMERAGAAAAEVARGMLADRREAVVVLAGPGNNGGDAFVVARLLRAAFFDVLVVSIADPAKLPKDAAAACTAYRVGGGAIASAPPAQRPALIIDGMFGVGLT